MSDIQPPAQAGVAEPIAADPAPAPELTLGDIDDVVKVIDYAANQGAFRGWDVIGQVLTLRTRLLTFLQMAGYQSPATSPPPPPPPPPPAPVEPSSAPVPPEGAGA